MTDLQFLDIQIGVFTVGALLAWNDPLLVRCAIGAMLVCLWALRCLAARRARSEKKRRDGVAEKERPGDA